MRWFQLMFRTRAPFLLSEQSELLWVTLSLTLSH
jgi:hypothetical protein